jgi:hypothetical protein
MRNVSEERGIVRRGLNGGEVQGLRKMQRHRAHDSVLQQVRQLSSHDLVYLISYRECQVKDWKEGHHKLICGKPASDIQRPGPPAPPSTDISPAEPGYVRSPALLHQIKLLRENSALDYVFVRPFPARDSGVRLGAHSNPLVAAMFTAFRYEAFRNGTPAAVRTMWDMLVVPARQADDFDVEALRRQMTKEFGFDPETVPTPGDEELREIMRAYSESDG